MKFLVAACSILALAAGAEMASSQKADAFFFGPVKAKDCHRIETHLYAVQHVWVCKGSKLPWWWTLNETVPIYSHHSDRDPGKPAVNPPAPPAYTPPPT